ncbi:MAG: dethiobiotin synthase [Oceanococcus sp.]
MPIVFVTGTDTGCGKTHISSALLQALNNAGQRAVGYKPIASGCVETPSGLRNDDAVQLLKFSAPGFHYEQINPIALRPAIAPHLAAQDVGIKVDLQQIIDGAEQLQAQADWVVVEGAGGFLVPLNEQQSFADLLETTQWPVLLVVAMRLGCINHALLSAEAIRQRTDLLAWCANVLPPQQERLDDNISSLRDRIEQPCLGVVHHARAELAAHELDSQVILRQLEGNPLK